MKRLLLIFVSLGLVFGVVAISDAGWNIKQKDTGATVWERDNGDQVPAGDPGLTVLLENISSASTAFVVSHKSGKIVKIYSVAHGATTVADAVLSFHIADSTTPTNFNAVTPGGTITIAGTGSAGDQDSASPTGENTVTQGQVISVTTDGGSTGDVDATITIIIE